MSNDTNTANPENSSGLFTELMPLVADRTLVLTISRIDDRTLCVNFVPKQAKTSENTALTTPLFVRGTPIELDQNLLTQLKGYVAAHVRLATDLEQAQKELDEAVKRARDDARKKNNSKTADKGTVGEAGSNSSKPEPKKEAPPAAQSPLSLFTDE